MDLTEKKRFKNLNGYADGKWLHGPSQQSLDGTVTTGVNFIGSAMKSFGPVKSSGDILQESGTSTAQGGGFTFQQQNPIDEGAQMSEVGKENTANTLQTAAAGAAAGAMFGPIGAAAGGVLGGVIGLFGGARRKSKMAEQIKKAQIQRVKNNNFSFSSGQSDYLAQQYNVEHDYTQDDQIYSAKDGMPPGYDDGKPNARVSHHEVIVDTETGKVDQMNGAPDKKDSILVHFRKPKKMAVISNNDPGDGIRNSDYLMATGDLNGALMRDQYYRDMKDFRTVKQLRYGSFDKLNGGLIYAKNGKLPRCADGTKYTYESPVSKLFGGHTDIVSLANNAISNMNFGQPKSNIAEDAVNELKKTASTEYLHDYRKTGGTTSNQTDSRNNTTYNDDSNLSNAITSGMGILGGLSQMMQANNQKLNKPDVYAGNDYLGRALNVYSYLSPATNRAVREAASTEARNRYNINRMGGLSGAQKYLATVQSGIGLQNNISNIYMDANKERNSYLSQYANAALNGGNAEAQRRQTANQYLDEAYARSNAAKLQMSQMGMQNMLAAFYQYYKNLEKNNRFMRTMSYYDQDYDLRRRELQKGL